jgi:hypothetical protein
MAKLRRPYGSTHDSAELVEKLCDPLSENIPEQVRLDMFVQHGTALVKEVRKLRSLLNNQIY